MKTTAAFALATLAFSAFAQDIDALTTDTKKTVLPVVPKVMAAMQEAVGQKGVADAIPVCREQAPKLIQQVREATGWSIRRVSLKVRNPERGQPDNWETATLQEMERKLAAGTKPETLEKSEIVQESGKSYFRYAKALPVADVCVACHGPAESMDGSLKAKLAETYPHDQAVGYSRGQIRGILSVKRPL
ncbi:MAG: cytochrome c family protein [Rhodocyclaceae bacterium]|nr:cytochrome c family protein [Rhodocyclaceae bacterium]